MSLSRCYVWPYNKNSQSAAALAEAMGILRVKSEGSVLKGAPDLFIINFGSGGNYFPNFLLGSTIINNPQKVLNAVDKVKFFSIADETYGLNTPEWTTSTAKAKAWLNKGIAVLARTQTEAKDGEGLVVMLKVTDFVSAPLYTQFVNSIYEYRVYVVDGVAVAAVKKVKGDNVKSESIRTESNGWLFSHTPLNSVPEAVKSKSILAVKACGLDFGGVDVLWDGSSAWVLEVNTAPYMGVTLATAVGKALEKLLISKGAKTVEQALQEKPTTHQAAPVVEQPSTTGMKFTATYVSQKVSWGVPAGTKHTETITAKNFAAAAQIATENTQTGWLLSDLKAA